MTVGAKKTITIASQKKKASYSFKASNKNISVTKKGVVTGKKPGKAKVTVKETYKKKARVIGAVSVTVKKKPEAPRATGTPTPTASPSATEGPTPEPSQTPAPTKKPAPSPTPGKPEVFYENHFEDGDMQGITGRGGTIEISKSENHTEGGQQCLLATGRSATWHGAQMDISDMVLPGNTYRICSWVKQKSGAAQKIAMKLQYKADGSDHYDSVIAEAKDGVETANDTWTKLEGSIAIPSFSGSLTLYWEIPASADLDFFVDDVEMEGVPVDAGKFRATSAIYAKMKEQGVLSTGNNARVKKAIEKARAGEDVTLAYIGGSVTEGALASPNSKCYAQVSAEAFASAYGKDGGANVHFVNAGMSGTPSALGIIRYERDVLGQMTAGDRPDILFIEFAVNDYQECTAETCA